MYGKVLLRANVFEAAKAYLKLKKPEEMVNIEDLNIMQYAITTINNHLFRYLYDNKEKFYAFSDKRSIGTYIEKKGFYHVLPLLKFEGSKNLEKAKRELITFDKAWGEQMIALAKVKVLGVNKPDKTAYFNKYFEYLKNYNCPVNDFSQLVWEISNYEDNYKKTLDKSIYQKAIELSTKVVASNKSNYVFDTHARLLHE
jgi:hypothetical protein